MRDWKELQQDRSVRRKPTSAREISFKIQLARLSSRDAISGNQSLTGQYKDLYDSAYAWCEIVLRAEGWRTQGEGHHETLFSGFRHFMGEEVESIADYLDNCRRIRNDLHYEWRPDTISQIEVDELTNAILELEQIVLSWLKQNHPELIPIE